jgi:hypothetical protein
MDAMPAGGAIARVEIQVDDGAWVWVAGPYVAGGDGGVSWVYHWYLPVEEGVEHEIRVRAVDAAGNVGPATEAVRVTVDSVAPSSTILYPEAGAVLGGPEVLVFGLASDGWGVAGVEVSLDGGQRWQAAVLGAEAQELLASVGVSEVPLRAQLPPGTEVWAAVVEARGFNLAIRSRATDLAGNVERVRAPVRVTLSHLQYWLPLVIHSE